VGILNKGGVTKMNWDSNYGMGNGSDFILALVTLKAIGDSEETSPLTIVVKEFYDENLDDITHTVKDGVFSITEIIPPYTSGHDPAPDDTGVPVDTNIVVYVSDDDSGVDDTSIIVTVEVGGSITPGITTIEGDINNYVVTVTYDANDNLDYQQQVNVSVEASDLSGNTMIADVYSFTTQSLLEANFSVDQTEIVGGDTVAFSDQTVGDAQPLSYEWDFDNDGIVDSTEQNPSWTPEVGTYTVCLTVTSSESIVDTECKIDYIVVNPQSDVLDAEFSADKTQIIEGETIAFTDETIGGDPS